MIQKGISVLKLLLLRNEIKGKRKISIKKEAISVEAKQTFVGLEDVLKTSSKRLQRNNFTSSKTSLQRRFEDVLKTSCKTF